MEIKTNPSHNLPKQENIDKGRYVTEMIDFVESKLHYFPKYLINSSTLQNLPSTIEGEDRITETLCDFMNAHEKNHNYCIQKQENFSFSFKNQPKLEGHKTGDLGVILTSPIGSINVIYVFEAKRLKTPGTGRLKEYAIGKKGGIERFKTNAHAKGLNSSGMIAYIQTESVRHWFSEVNSWIDDEISSSSNSAIEWKNIDKLMQDNSFSKPKVTKYNSEHSRISNSNITLSHYWIDLT
jgi:hypothetical protein